jgi:hypothetical protein
MIKETVKVIEPKRDEAVKGTAGLRCHVGGVMATVSNVARASGGVGGGRLVDRDVK